MGRDSLLKIFYDQAQIIYTIRVGTNWPITGSAQGLTNEASRRVNKIGLGKNKKKSLSAIAVIL